MGYKVYRRLKSKCHGVAVTLITQSLNQLHVLGDGGWWSVQRWTDDYVGFSGFVLVTWSDTD